MSTEISRLRWLCRRGMKELDVLLSRYLEERFPDASEAEQQSFRDLLDMQDPTIFAMLLGREESSDAGISSLVGELTRMRG